MLYFSFCARLPVPHDLFCAEFMRCASDRNTSSAYLGAGSLEL